MFTVVRGEYIRQALDTAINHWWERQELPALMLLRDGLLLLEQGDELNVGQRALLLRAALAYGKGVITALRHQSDFERTAVLLNDALMVSGSTWTAADLQNWMQKDPQVTEWKELLRIELLATNQVALPSQRSRIATLLTTIRSFEIAPPASKFPTTKSPVGKSDWDNHAWELVAEATMSASPVFTAEPAEVPADSPLGSSLGSPMRSLLRYLIALVLLGLLATYFYQRYWPLLGKSDMIEVNAYFQPVSPLQSSRMVQPTATSQPTLTAQGVVAIQPTSVLATVVAQQSAMLAQPLPTRPLATPTSTANPETALSVVQPASPLQPESPLQPFSPLSPADPFQPVSPLRSANSATPSATATSSKTSTATAVPTNTPLPTATPSPSETPTATATPSPTALALSTEESVAGVRTVLIDRSEVTNAEYRQCVTANKCAWPVSNDSVTRKDYFLTTNFGDFPVINIDLASANDYCHFRGKRLPAADEWEAAASLAPATKRRYRYPWGDQFSAQFGNSSESQRGDTTVIGFYRPHGSSPLGFDDMAGNAAEWTATRVIDEGIEKAVVKGGSFRDQAVNLQSDSLQLVDVSLPNRGSVFAALAKKSEFNNLNIGD